jgi:hypothetical protein
MKVLGFLAPLAVIFIRDAGQLTIDAPVTVPGTR